MWVCLHSCTVCLVRLMSICPSMHLRVLCMSVACWVLLLLKSHDIQKWGISRPASWMDIFSIMRTHAQRKYIAEMSSPTPVAFGKEDPCSSSIYLTVRSCPVTKWVMKAKCSRHWLGLSKECLSRCTGYEENEETAKLIKPDLKEWCKWRQSYGWDCVSPWLSGTHYT